MGSEMIPEATEKKSRERSVSFNAVVETRLIPSCKDDSLAQKFLKHYTRQCFKSVREDVMEDIKDMRRGVPEDDISLSYRGLEHMASSGQHGRRKRRRAYVDAVLLEQYRQWTASLCNPVCNIDHDLLAQIATAFSSNDAQLALEKASKDAADVQDIIINEVSDKVFAIG